ncbi:sortase [Candidatus Roizmanbacteria bacterium]|nr:sortase [Candidatus Roizmanbacteria bacterium]
MPKKKQKFKPPIVILNSVQNLTKNFSKLSLQTKALFIFGLLFLGIPFFWNLNQSIQLAFFTPHVTPVKKTYAIPTQLIIKKVDIDLPIEETAITNGIWQIASNVSHLTISARPGEQGPIIMYGHNTDDRLGPIRWLSVGEIVQIKTADNKTHNYKINQTLTVASNKMDILTQKKGETLIIYTCDGFADLQRFVLIAKPN